ncbi:ATP-dependent helicase/nuclease subunit A [Nymphon striatum]|nr:ATP-dependent helicase/nuclease subunit A [Nymphon striatum]
MEGRKKILNRLGLEAEDVLDSFLDEALNFTNDRSGGLETFITELTKAEPVIKREVELERDEVRILTVHSSKGLEARVVFLKNTGPEILEIKNDQGQNGYLWLTSKEQHVEATRSSTALIGEAAEAEYRRLLYVGMTRAADRLVVCGYRGTREPNHPYWHQMVENSLNDAGELTALHWISKAQPAVSANPSDQKLPLATDLKSIPEWLNKPARADAPLPRPLTPSGAFALIDRGSLTNETLKFGATAETNSFAIQRGNATHKLFEVLPDILPENRLSLATDYLDKTCSNLSPDQRAEILNSIFGILSDDRFKGLFEGEARAEVSLAGRLDVKSGSMLVTGQIDRLIISDDRVTILDYKTNRSVPNSIADTPDEYITQLALYRDLVSPNL